MKYRLVLSTNCLILQLRNRVPGSIFGTHVRYFHATISQQIYFLYLISLNTYANFRTTENSTLVVTENSIQDRAASTLCNSDMISIDDRGTESAGLGHRVAAQVV